MSTQRTYKGNTGNYQPKYSPYRKNYKIYNTAAPRKAQVKRNYKVAKHVSRGGAELGGLAGQALGALTGSAMGGPVGTAVGSALGGIAGYGLAKVMGYGSYKIKKNVFMEGRLPQMVNMPSGGGTVIRFQEYLSDVYTTADISDPGKFDIQSFLINPANSKTFPWLNQIASNYEQYFIEGMLFEFRSTSANALNSTNTALGSVLLCTNYDVAEPVFRSKAEMLNYEYSNSVKPSHNCVHMIECAPNQSVLTGLYTLDGAVPPNTDSRLYHLGRFSIATVGFQAANVNIGELHVTYQIRLLKPKLYAELGLANDWALLQNAGTWSNASPLGGTWSKDVLDNIDARVESGTCIIPASSVIKSYRIEIFWNGVSTAGLGDILSVLTLANCDLAGTGQVPPPVSTTSTATILFAITTRGNSKDASFSVGTVLLPASPVSAAIRIMQVPQGSVF